MSNYYLRKWNDPILRQQCRTVEDFSELDGVISGLYDVLFKRPILGIAAPQIGDDRQILIAKIGKHFEFFVNPKIVGSTGYIPSVEGCLSFPGLIVPTIRRRIISVESQDKNGKLKHGIYRGMNSIILQHEIDHLNGRLMFNYFK